MPKLWNDTIEEHRREVHDAILGAASKLLAAHGLRSITMLQIAEKTGIGRATLYKYFPDIEAILAAWHERQIGEHLTQLSELARRSGTARQRLTSVLEAYAQIQHEHQGGELEAMLHRGEHVARAQSKLKTLLKQLLAEAADAGEIRDDIAADELAAFCLHALIAARGLRSKPAVERLVTVTMTALEHTR